MLCLGVTEECRLKQEIHFMDHHEKGCGQKVMTNAGTTQVAEKLPNSLSLLTHSQVGDLMHEAGF